MSRALNSKLFFKSGDSVYLSGRIGGYFTTDGKDLFFSIPTAKNLEYIKTVKIEEARLAVRQNNSYCVGSASGYETLDMDTNNLRAYVSKNSGCIDIWFTFPKARASLNNDACGVDYKITVSLE